MPSTEEARVSLNLDAPFESQAARAAAAGQRLVQTLDDISAASQRATARDLGIKTDAAAFSTASSGDFKRSAWEPPSRPSPWASPAAPQDPRMPPAPGAAEAAPAGKKSLDIAVNGKIPPDLRYLLKQVGVGKAALKAPIVAAGFNLTELALGRKGLAQLQALELRASVQGRQLFAGVDAQPVVRATDRFFQIVNKGTPAGKALSSILSSAFNPFFSAVERAEPYISTFVKGMILGALEVQTAWYDLRLAILPVTEAIASIDAGPVDGLGTAADVATAPFRALAAVIREIGVGYEALARNGVFGAQESQRANDKYNQERAEEASANASRMAGKSQVFERTEGSGGAWQRNEGEEVARAVQTGLDIANGLADGIYTGVPAVAAAGARAGQAAVDGARSPAGADAHSPSRKGIKTGRDVGEGLVVGQDASLSDVAAAGARLGAKAVPSAGGAGALAGTGITIASLTVQVAVTGGKGAEENARRGANIGVRAGLREIAAQLGVPLEVAAA